MNSSLAPVMCSASVYGLVQNADEGWHLSKMWVEPIFAVKLYVLFVLLSLLVALVQLLRSWILAPPFRRTLTDSAQRPVPVFRRQALSLLRWMVLNALVWAGVTVAGLSSLFRGTWSSRPVQMQFFALGLLEEVLRPAALFCLTLIVLYVVRWHILWRAERLERRQQRVPEEHFSARISG